MRYATKVVFDIETGNIDSENTCLYLGNIEYLKGGPSADQSAAMASMNALRDTLTANYRDSFANQTAILGAIKNALDPILQAGISQFGFSKPEESAMRTQASENTVGQLANVQRALNEKFASQGGGNALLPSGVQAQATADLYGKAIQLESQQQLGITQAGYETGRQNFLAALTGESNVAAQWNPLGYANAAENAASNSFNMATELYKQKKAASPWGAIGGLAGGLLGSMAGPLGASIGSKIGGMFGGLGSTSSMVPPDYNPQDDPNMGTG